MDSGNRPAATLEPPRIALLIESDGPGGAEYSIIRLAEELRRRGHRVVPFVPSDGCGWLARRLRAEHIDVETFTLRRSLDPLCVSELFRAFRRHRIDVVHSHEFAMAVYGCAAARLAGAAHVITMHGSDYFHARRRRTALRWAARHSHAAVAVSAATSARLAGGLGTGVPLRVIPNGVPHRQGSADAGRAALGLGPDEPLILAVGNLYPVKGHDVLLDALGILARERPELRWAAAIAGRGDEEGRLRRIATERGIQGRVQLPGFRDDVPDLIAAAGIFAMPSRSEGLPLALLEAMAHGRAVVASRVGGIPEAVREEVDGLLVEPGDPARLADALLRLLTDGGLRKRLGRSARRRVLRRFSQRAMTDSYQELYHAAAAERGSGRVAGGRPTARTVVRATADSPVPPRPAPAADPPRGFAVRHVIAPATVGGAESVLLALAAGQHGRGHDVGVIAVLSPDSPDPPFLTQLETAGVRVDRIIVRPRAYKRERSAIAELLGRTRPDIVHTHGYRPDTVDAGVARRLGIAVVSTVHGYTAGGLKRRCYEVLQRLALRRFDAVIAVSRPLAEMLRRAGVPVDRVHTIRNGWAERDHRLSPSCARERLGVRDDRFHIGWVGRLTREKGPDVLLDALEHLRDVPLVVSMVGDGEDASALRARATTARPGRVVWHGLLPGAARLFAAFDLFVLSSRSEGTPIALFEAMAAGVPLVATRVGGVPDVVPADEGVLVAPEDPVALAAAVRQVHADPAAAAARARAARDRLHREFGLDQWLDRHDAVYARALSHARHGSALAPAWVIR